MAITARAVTEPWDRVSMRIVARPLPTVAPFGTLVWKVAVPAPSVVPSWVIGATPGMLRVKVTVAPSAGRPSGSVAVAVNVSGAGSRDSRNETPDVDSVAD